MSTRYKHIFTLEFYRTNTITISRYDGCADWHICCGQSWLFSYRTLPWAKKYVSKFLGKDYHTLTYSYTKETVK